MNARKIGSLIGRRGRAAVVLLPLLLVAPLSALAGDAPTAPGGASAPADQPDAECNAAVQDARTIAIDCTPGFATAHDRVLVYPRAGTRTDVAGELQLDQHDAVWLFQPGAGRQTALIIDFHPGGGGSVVADIYDDGNGDATVAYVSPGGVPAATENRGRPTLTFSSRDGWWTREDRTSFNLDIHVDGPVRATFFSPHFLGLLDTEGEPDYVISVRDEDADGRPELEWRQFHPPLTEDIYLAAHYRTEIAYNTDDDEVDLERGLLWPYLAPLARMSQAGEYVKPYNGSPPPLEVDWARGRIVQLGEFVASRGNPGSCFIYSIARIVEGTHSVSNFENPFCFYDLAGVGDGWPDMSIRSELTLPEEVPHLRLARPITIVEYSWDEQHDHTWNYALNVVGQPPADGVTRFSDFSVGAVPYAELPAWVARQEWAAATFVELNTPYWSNEHVYEYTVEDGNKVLLRYLAGLDAEPPITVFEQVPEGFRGEYALHLDGPARVYLSPIDRRLHLYGAEAGRWNMGDGRELRYGSLAGREVDHWALWQDGALVSELYALGDRAIYASVGGVHVGAIEDTGPAELLTAPRNRDDWNGLRNLLEESAIDVAPDDLRGLFRAAATDVAWLPNASLRDVTLTENGFRFGVSLVEVPFTAPWADGTAAGDYLVEYERGSGFRLTPRPQPQLEVAGVEVVGGVARAGEAAPIRVTVSNHAPVDAESVRVELHAAAPDGATVAVGSLELAVPANGTARRTIEWTPSAAGDWTIHVVLNGSPAPAAPLSVAVLGAPLTGREQLASQAQLPSLLLAVAYLLLGVAAIAAAALGARHFGLSLAGLRSTRGRDGTTGSSRPAWWVAGPTMRPRPALAWSTASVAAPAAIAAGWRSSARSSAVLRPRSLPIPAWPAPVSVRGAAARAASVAWPAFAVGIVGAEALVRLVGAVPGAAFYGAVLVLALNSAARTDGMRAALLLALATIAITRVIGLTVPLAGFEAVISLGLLGALAALAVAGAVRLGGLSRTELGLTSNRVALRLAVLIAPVAVVAGVALASALPGQPALPANALPGQLAAAVGLFLVAGLVEEVLFRGLLLASAARLLGAPAAVVISAVLFAAASVAVWQPAALGVGLLIGALLALSTLYTRSLLPAIVAHGCLSVSIAVIAPLVGAG